MLQLPSVASIVPQTGPVDVSDEVRGTPERLNEPEGPVTEENFAPLGLVSTISACPADPPLEFAS